MDEAVPAWFREAIAVEATSHHLVHEDCRLHYRSWGQPGRPGVMLVHGGAAHSHWWDFIAPALAERYFVVAPDLSGHGESGRRERYPLRTWAGELLAVAEHAGFEGKPAVVGHSMGGVVSIVARALFGDSFAGTVIVDAPVRSVAEQQERVREGKSPFGLPRTYPTREAAVAAFRLIPAQPCENGFIVRHIASHSVREVEGGFSWKFDPGIMRRTTFEPLDEQLADGRCPAALIVGERSEIVPPAMVDTLTRLAGPRVPLVRLEDAFHHVLLDQPRAFIDAVAREVDTWLSSR